EIAPNRYVDLHIPGLRPSPLETVRKCRAAITQVTQRVVDCRVVIMTLGLSELWFDAQSGCYLNRAPIRTLVTRFPERFEVHLLSFEETMAHLNSAFDLLRRTCRTDQKTLLTVSPVPLGVTHLEGDALVVNSYSKSVLRTAAEHIATQRDNVDYFPSYESVVLSDRTKAWHDDLVHVEHALIALNVQRMVDAYRPDALPVSQAQIGDAMSD